MPIYSQSVKNRVIVLSKEGMNTKQINKQMGLALSGKTIKKWINLKPEPTKQEIEEFIDELLVSEDKLKREVERLNKIIEIYRIV